MLECGCIIPHPLQLELTDRLDLHSILDLHQRRRTDEDLSRLGFVAKARGDICIHTKFSPGRPRSSDRDLRAPVSAGRGQAFSSIAGDTLPKWRNADSFDH
jgi:hypothetical protein